MHVTVTDPRKTAPGRSAIFAEIAALTATWDQHTLIPDAEKNRALALGKQLNNDWSGESLTKDQAIAYIRDYGAPASKVAP